MIKKSIIEIIYLISAIAFIIGLKFLSNPKKARQGNSLAAGGMILAIIVTIFEDQVKNLGWIFSGIMIGSVLGVISAKKVKMKAVPQIISFFNGVGGACAGIICAIQFTSHPAMLSGTSLHSVGFFIILGIFLGMVALAGSLIVMSKYLSWVSENPIRYPLQRVLNFFLLGIVISIATFALLKESPDKTLVFSFATLSFLYGVLFVLPFSGREITILISFLNAVTGVTSTILGFIFDNQIMIITGILVVSSGLMLAVLMSRAIDRSLFSVIIGRGRKESLEANEKNLPKSIGLSDASILLTYARKVIIVPGQGLAKAGAHYACHELEVLLEKLGATVKYAIHPLAGRMPGHMNVLLAEANVSYEKLLVLEDANREFSTTDVVLVVGANDIINPLKDFENKDPLGMPILDIGEAKNILILNRNFGKGFIGMENSLIYSEKTWILAGDAKQTLYGLTGEILKNSI